MPSGDQFFPATGMPDPDWWQALWPSPRDVLRKLGIKEGDVVADLCCGDGYFTGALAKLTGAETFAVDLDPDQLAAAQSRGIRERITWLLGDAREIDVLMPEPVNVVLMANTFHGVPEPTELSGAVARALVPDGRFIIVNWHARPREETPVFEKPRGPATGLRLSPVALEGLVAPAGFTREDVIELPPYHYGTVFRKSGDRS